ncbi:hypothetical protein O181_002077 [Austropuccinia psidii MF-1]|uniref:Uncharacterized protein n=1 Tax=Austropuccinia psidii MF-1 TaxID=1389203 RepID=A0A9Q3BC36_9BASI|nr:hypothetical protein [Austropuccinia psidii MF-1]
MKNLSSHSFLPSLNYLSGRLSASLFLPFKIPEQLNQSNSIQDPPSKLIPEIIEKTLCLVGLEEIERKVGLVLALNVSENKGNVLLLSGPRYSGKKTVSFCWKFKESTQLTGFEDDSRSFIFYCLFFHTLVSLHQMASSPSSLMALFTPMIKWTGYSRLGTDQD